MSRHLPPTPADLSAYGGIGSSSKYGDEILIDDNDDETTNNNNKGTSELHIPCCVDYMDIE
jgi:hypothetical protein